MSKSDLYLIVGNLFLAQHLRNKPLTLLAISVFYMIMYCVNLGTEVILK
jgi:hypothetical protein